MTEHRAVLKRVGLVLVAVGLADVAVMIYCIATRQSYSSSINVFAVAAGVFLIRGSLAAAHWVACFSAFLLAVLIGRIFILFPFLQSLDLLATQARLAPGVFVASWLITGLSILFLCWAYLRLRSAPIVAALRADGRNTAMPKLAFGLGVALIASLAVMLHLMLRGAAAEKAVELARQQAGPGYRYTMQSIRWGGGKGAAVVVAYNDSEIKHVPVEWTENGSATDDRSDH